MSEEAVEIEDEYRRSKRNKTANRQYQDYKLYVTIEEQEDRPDYEEDDPIKMASVAHYFIVRMPDCCLQGIQPFECKGEGHRWIGNQVFR
jgi:hypothetical protein